MAGVRETRVRRAIVEADFHLPHGVPASHWLRGVFFFSLNFNRKLLHDLSLLGNDHPQSSSEKESNKSEREQERERTIGSDVIL